MVFSLQSKFFKMIRLIAALLFVLFLSSCAQSITPYQAANGGYKKCRDIR